MARTVDVTLDGITYKVPAMNFGQIERASEAMQTTNSARAGFTLLRIALERSDPKVENLDTIQPSIDEITEAATKIMEASGFKAPDTSNPTGAPPAGA